MIRLRFVAGTGILSKAVRVFENRFWATHVDAVMPDGKLLGAYINSGVRARASDYDANTISRHEIIHLLSTAKQETAFYAFLTAQIGKPFDLVGIVGLAVGRNWRNKNAWWCSDLQVAALDHCGWCRPPLARQTSRITPRDLMLILNGRTNTGQFNMQ